MLGQILVTKQTGPQGKVVSKVGMAICSSCTCLLALENLCIFIVSVLYLDLLYHTGQPF